MSERRQVEYNEGDFGLWSLTCAECPLLPHAEALGAQPPRCAGGMATNMQGPVMLDQCKHLARDSAQNESGNKLSIECRYAAPDTQDMG